MPLEPTALSSLVFADYLAAFPTALAGTRPTPVPHVVSEAFIEALCTGVVTAVLTLPINDLGAGTIDIPGVAPPVPVAFPGAPSGVPVLVAQAGMLGPAGLPAATVFVVSTLLGISKLGLLTMNPNVLMGTGTGVVSPASNPALQAAAQAALIAALPPAFQASGKFSVGDVPGGPLHAPLLAKLPAFAAGIATGFATITAQTAYVGTASVPGPIAGAVNTGFIV
jgi:hypothetical protein